MITPSFNLTATERVLPKLALDFTTANLDPRVTFTRVGNTATVTNSSGYIAAINANLPRFDYDPITKVLKGLLIEESRVNSLTYSAAFDDGSWTKLNSSISATKVSAPDGLVSGQKLVENTANSVHVLVKTVTGLTGGTSQTVSVYAKAAERTRIVIGSFDGTSGLTASFNLLTGVVNSASSGVTATMQSVGDGWYRCVCTRTIAVAATSLEVNLYLDNATSGNPSVSYTGNGTSGAYWWAAQLEAGAFPTSYIPTEATTVTRNADVATMTGTDFSDWYNAGVGGIVARVLPSTVSGTRPALQLDDATADEIIALRGNTTNPELVIVDGGSPQAQIDAGTIAANTAYNLGAAWDTNNCAAAVNGGAAVTDTTATIPTVTQARLGSDGTNYLNGHIQTLRYWPQRIMNAEVQAFSK